MYTNRSTHTFKPTHMHTHLRTWICTHHTHTHAQAHSHGERERDTRTHTRSLGASLFWLSPLSFSLSFSFWHALTSAHTTHTHRHAHPPAHLSPLRTHTDLCFSLSPPPPPSHTHIRAHHTYAQTHTLTSSCSLYNKTHRTNNHQSTHRTKTHRTNNSTHQLILPRIQLIVQQNSSYQHLSINSSYPNSPYQQLNSSYNKTHRTKTHQSTHPTQSDRTYNLTHRRTKLIVPKLIVPTTQLINLSNLQLNSSYNKTHRTNTYPSTHRIQTHRTNKTQLINTSYQLSSTINPTTNRTACRIWSVISTISNLNPWSSSLGLFCHVPLKRNQQDWDWRLRFNDTPSAIGYTNISSYPCSSLSLSLSLSHSQLLSHHAQT